MAGSVITSSRKRRNLIVLLLFLTACPGKKQEKSEPVFTEQSRVIARGENLDAVLIEMLSPEIAAPITKALKTCGFPFRRCIPGDSICIVRKDGNFNRMTYYQNIRLQYYITRDNGHLIVSMKLPCYDTLTCVISGVINSTLYESLLNIGETPNLVWRFADIYAWEIDFVTDTRNADSFTILVNKIFCDSEFVEYDIPVATKYVGEVGTYYSIYYSDPDGNEDYYNLKGESLRKSLLKSPLRYSYISSYFSKRRFHPILKVWRPHHGLDYSAPTGTPVSSIGDGIVIFKGWRGGYGNLIEIQHKNNFSTRYGHLSRYTKGIYKGKRVKAGELIGYVGSTGLSTGPHLHFELHRKGVAVNPFTVNVPRAPSVKKKYLSEFEVVRDSLVQYLDRQPSPEATEQKSDI